MQKRQYYITSAKTTDGTEIFNIEEVLGKGNFSNSFQCMSLEDLKALTKICIQEVAKRKEIYNDNVQEKERKTQLYAYFCDIDIPTDDLSILIDHLLDFVDNNPRKGFLIQDKRPKDDELCAVVANGDPYICYFGTLEPDNVPMWSTLYADKNFVANPLDRWIPLRPYLYPKEL